MKLFEGNTPYLLQQLVKRDFTKRYKRTFLGFAWSVLSPLLLLSVMNFVFVHVFGRDTPHYSVVLFSGFIHFRFFSSTTSGLMHSMVSNAYIYNKVQVEKILFVIADTGTHMVTFLCTILVYFIFLIADGMPFSLMFFWLIVPFIYIVLLSFFIGLIISIVYVYIRDMKYLWPVLMRITMYGSAVFYNPTIFSEKIQSIFWFNPLYLAIYFTRSIVIHQTLPSGFVFVLMFLFLAAFGGIAYVTYQRCQKSIYLYL